MATGSDASAAAAAPRELHPVIAHHVVNTLGWQSLRPLQEAAIVPVLAGDDALLIAPTAGGKTEAAVLPLLSRMQYESWRPLSTLYICPLRALLNNLQPRLDGYARWVGRSARLWHGDSTQAMRRRILVEPPDVLLTTPESLEAILVSSTIDYRALLGSVRAVVIDEIHAFAGDDRGVHLGSVLDRLEQVTPEPLQRLGLSATVGNPAELLAWLQAGSGRQGRVIAPGMAFSSGSGPVSQLGSAVASAGTSSPVDADITVDFVGSLENAATVLAAIHRGEKKLIFVDSRREAENLAAAVNSVGIRAFVSHSSLSAAERDRTERAFAESSNCVVVATSTLELGIDVGDVDSVVQIGAPGSVASFLQRLGRTGRRAGTRRSMLFLCAEEDRVLQAAGLLLLWRRGFVEPILPPPVPRHLLAQQLLALCLQYGRVGRAQWRDYLPGFDRESLDDGDQIAEFLLATGHLDSDQGMLFIGPRADETFGKFYFRDLVTSFTTPPEFAVLYGRRPVGTVDPAIATRRVEGPRRLLLAGKAWQVREIDWSRRRMYVEPSDVAGVAQWSSFGRAQSFALTDAMRAVVCGADLPGVTVSDRATRVVATLRAEHQPHSDARATVVVPRDGLWNTWWTWAGGYANMTLAAGLDIVDPGLVAEEGRASDLNLRISAEAGVVRLRQALRALAGRTDPWPGIPINPAAIRGLKFNEMLPDALARDTISRRLSDTAAARVRSREPIIDRTAY